VRAEAGHGSYVEGATQGSSPLASVNGDAGHSPCHMRRESRPQQGQQGASAFQQASISPPAQGGMVLMAMSETPSFADSSVHSRRDSESQHSNYSSSLLSTRATSPAAHRRRTRKEQSFTHSVDVQLNAERGERDAPPTPLATPMPSPLPVRRPSPVATSTLSPSSSSTRRPPAPLLVPLVPLVTPLVAADGDPSKRPPSDSLPAAFPTVSPPEVRPKVASRRQRRFSAPAAMPSSCNSMGSFADIRESDNEVLPPLGARRGREVPHDFLRDSASNGAHGAAPAAAPQSRKSSSQHGGERIRW